MGKKSITEILFDKYHNDISENSRKITLKEAASFNGYESYFYDELPNINVKGFPIGSDFLDDKGNVYTMLQHEKLPKSIKDTCRLRYHYLPLSHEFYIGTTGSGKTTGCVEPQLRAICNQHNKPNIFITDPKGEIYNHNAKFLKNQGYKTFVLNFKNVKRSDKWNPLLEIYESYQRIVRFKVSPTLIEGKVDKSKDLTYFSDNINPGYYYLFENYVFSSIEDFNIFAQQEKDLIVSETDSLIKQFSHMFCPVASTKDPTWEQGSRQTVEGIISIMLDLSVDKKSGFTKDMFTIKTLFDLYYRLAEDLIYRDNYNTTNHPLLIRNPKASEKVLVTFGNAEKTMRSYVGVFEGQTNDWHQGHIYALTTGNTVEIENLDQPFAIFVITRDYEKSDFTIAGLFIDYVYRTLVKRNDELLNKGLPIPRPTHFLLDEFGNIPKIENFENKIATCRSRNIWMHLFLQSYQQINFVYDDKQASIILSNCNSHIYLGSQDHDSIERFSKECGKKHSISLDGNFNVSPNPIETPVLKFSDLDLIEPGSMYIKRLYSPAMYSHYIRSYYLNYSGYFNDFTNDGLISCTPNNFAGFNSDRFTYKIKYR